MILKSVTGSKDNSPKQASNANWMRIGKRHIIGMATGQEWESILPIIQGNESEPDLITVYI